MYATVPSFFNPWGKQYLKINCNIRDFAQDIPLNIMELVILCFISLSHFLSFLTSCPPSRGRNLLEIFTAAASLEDCEKLVKEKKKEKRRRVNIFT